MTLFPFYKNMLQFSGWSCFYKNGALLDKLQPRVLNLFVLIWGCLLYCEYTAYGTYQKKLNSNISLYVWVVAKLFILWTRIPSTKNLNSYSFHIRTEFCPIISDMSCLPLKALIFCLFYKMYLMAVLKP